MEESAISSSTESAKASARNGFSTYPSAPAASAWARSIGRASAVITSIGTSRRLGVARIRSQSAKPLASGSRRSRQIRSGVPRSSRVRACAAVSDSCTRIPSRRRHAATSRRASGSSSMTRASWSCSDREAPGTLDRCPRVVRTAMGRCRDGDGSARPTPDLSARRALFVQRERAVDTQPARASHRVACQAWRAACGGRGRGAV